MHADLPARITAAVGVAAIPVVASMPWWAERATIFLAVEMLAMLALAQMWNLLAGYGGLLSVGQQGFVGLGAYALVVFGLQAGINAFLVIPLAGVVGAVAAALVAPLLFRLSGAHFAIGTWVVAEVFRLVAAQTPALGGGSGASLPADIVKSLADSRDLREAMAYWLALGVMVLTVGTVFLILRSRRGLALTAIRDNELAARSLGIDIWRTKFFVYVVTAGLTALVGGLIFLQKLRISPDAAFSANDWTAFVIFIVVIGGIGTLEGPIIGTLLFFALRETMAEMGTIYLIALGVVAIAVMLKAPTGLWGVIRARTGAELFPLSRRVQGIGRPDG